jgi:hypothetical protein
MWRLYVHFDVVALTLLALGVVFMHMVFIIEALTACSPEGPRDSFY